MEGCGEERPSKRRIGLARNVTLRENSQTQKGGGNAEGEVDAQPARKRRSYRSYLLSEETICGENIRVRLTNGEVHRKREDNRTRGARTG